MTMRRMRSNPKVPPFKGMDPDEDARIANRALGVAGL